MQPEFKDNRLKYLEMPRQFKDRANDITLTCKQHLRICEQLAVRLAKEKPKTAQEFEKNEYLKNFVIKSSRLNEEVLGVLDYTLALLNEIANDYKILQQAQIKDTLRLQSETVEILIQQRDQLVNDLYDVKRQLIQG